MVNYLLKKSYRLKNLEEIEFKDLWGDNGVFTTMWIFGSPPKILFFRDHINNLIKSTKAYSILKAPAPKIDGGESGGSNAPTTQQTSPNLGFEGRSSGSEQFGAQVVRAYVTESDITTSQNTASNIQELSQIG